MPVNALRTDYIADIGRQFNPVQATSNALSVIGQQKGLNAMDQQARLRGLDEMIKRQAISRFAFKNEKEAAEYLSDSLPKVTLEMWPQARQHFIELGVEPSLMPESFATQDEFDQYKKTAEQFLIDYQKGARFDVLAKEYGLKTELEKTKHGHKMEEIKARGAFQESVAKLRAKPKNLLTTDEKNYLREVAEYEEGSGRYPGIFAEWRESKEDAKLQRQKDLAEYKAGLKQKDAQSYILPDNTIVQSFDGGRTYVAADGSRRKIPAGAMRARAQITGSELSMLKAQRQAQETTVPQAAQTQPMAQVAESGTGPYAMLAAAVDRFFGGAGVDVLFGKRGFFQDTQENRQTLRTIKQIGKAALMNSSRGAIWEQKRIDNLFPDPDKLFTNPRTEAKKFKTLRDTLLEVKRFNNEAIVASTTPNEVSRLRSSNIEIDRLLTLLGEAPAQSQRLDAVQQAPDILTPDERSLMNKYLQ